MHIVQSTLALPATFEIPFVTVHLHDVAGGDSAGLHDVVPHQDGLTVAIRIAYHKFPKEVWPVEEFVETQVTLPRGETVTMKLTERGA